MRKLTPIAAALGLLTVAAAVPAQPTDDSAVGEGLPAHLRGLLIQEMLAILDASKTILDAIVRGDDERVAEHAQAIHDSFILAQQMTDADSEALHEALPHAFLERDEAFHELSAELAVAARAGDRARQRELFAEMLEACVDCHAAHAANRFPALAGEGTAR